MLNRVTFFFSTKLRIFTMCPRSVGVAKTDRAREREGREASVAFPWFMVPAGLGHSICPLLIGVLSGTGLADMS